MNPDATDPGDVSVASQLVCDDAVHRREHRDHRRNRNYTTKDTKNTKGSGFFETQNLKLLFVFVSFVSLVS
jgi:hypothetical protein